MSAAASRSPIALPDAFWHPTKRRLFNRAIIVHLGRFLFNKLDQIGQQEVENELAKVFSKISAIPYAAWSEGIGKASDQVALMRGIAMARLSISTGTSGLNWDTFVPRSWFRKPLLALIYFRSFDTAVDDAAEYLRSKGVPLDEFQVHGHRWMKAVRARYP